MFYDLNVKVELEKAAGMAKRLGFSGIGITIPWDNRAAAQDIRARAKSMGVDVAAGIELAGKPSDVVRIVKSIRKESELILVRGGTEEINRAALETPEVDILTGTSLENGEPGINHILARLGARNNVAICFDFWSVMQSYKKTRSQVLSSYKETARFVRKYKCPFVLSAGSMNEWDMKAASELIAFGKFLGFQENECRRALSGDILKENRKRLSAKWVMPGVEIE